MFREYFQNSAGPAENLHSLTASPAYRWRDNPASPLSKLMGRLRATLAGIDRRRRIEYENRRAIAHLESLSDEQLRDIGIARELIERSVRLGRQALPAAHSKAAGTVGTPARGIRAV